MKKDDPRREYDSVEKYLPKNGWLGKYLNYTQGLEFCPRFRFFSSASVLGAAINNKAWIQRGDEDLLPKLFPNVWVLLLAPPGRGHKTSAINMPTNCLMEACPDVRILADKLTPEYLVKGLSAPVTKGERIRIGPRDATGLIKAPEVSVFFGRQQYNVGLVSLITDLYDYREEWRGGTIGRGGETLKNVCISILGGSTPDWLQCMLPQDAFTGGFMSRFVIVELPTAYFKRITEPKRPKDISWAEIVSGLSEISRQKGVITWGKGSKEAYDKYYQASAPTGNTQRDAYRERETEQILKISMLLAISVKRMELSGNDIDQAANIIYALREEVDSRIDRLTSHPRMHVTQEIKDLLRMHGELGEDILLSKVYKNLEGGERQYYEALNILRKTNQIEILGKSPNYSYKLKEEKKDD